MGIHLHLLLHQQQNNTSKRMSRHALTLLALALTAVFAFSSAARAPAAIFNEGGAGSTRHLLGTAYGLTLETGDVCECCPWSNLSCRPQGRGGYGLTLETGEVCTCCPWSNTKCVTYPPGQVGGNLAKSPNLAQANHGGKKGGGGPRKGKKGEGRNCKGKNCK